MEYLLSLENDTYIAPTSLKVNSYIDERELEPIREPKSPKRAVFKKKQFLDY